MSDEKLARAFYDAFVEAGARISVEAGVKPPNSPHWACVDPDMKAAITEGVRGVREALYGSDPPDGGTPGPVGIWVGGPATSTKPGG